MGVDQDILSGVSQLSEEDKRWLADLIRFLRSRHSPESGEIKEDSREWTRFALQSLLAEGDHPGEVDYSLDDAREVFPG